MNRTLIVKDIAEDFKLLGDKNRLAILGLLREEELCVCELVEILGLSQPGISQHLRKLKDAGIVRENRKSQWIFYSLANEDKPHVSNVVNTLPSMRDRIDELRHRGLKVDCSS